MSTETTELGQDLALIIDNSIPILKQAPEVLKANVILKEKALIVGRNILSAFDESGLSPELDERAMKFLANVDKAKTKMKDDRSGITQIMDDLKKMYTTTEAELDSKKEGTIPFQVQGLRNHYARKVAEEKERKRQEEERIANRKKEAIELRSQMATNYVNQYLNHLAGLKQKMVANFNSITLEDFDTKSALLKAYVPKFNFVPTGGTASAKYHNADEVKALADEVLQEKQRDYAEGNYTAEMNLLKEELVDKLPSKLAELKEAKRLADEAEEQRRIAEEEEKQRQKEIEKANAEEKKRLEAEAEQRRKENQRKQDELRKQQEEQENERLERERLENERIARETEELKERNQQQEDLKAQGEQTMVMFEKEAALAETVEAPEARQGFEISVLHPVGFTQIFALWFEKVGKDLPIDKIGNTKLDQMKAWAEKEAHKNGTKIDSKFIKYEPTYKAVNRK